MAVEVANDTHLGFGSTGSLTTEVDRTTYFTSLNFPLEQAEVETTAFGNSGNRDFLPGLKGATITGEGNWDSTIDAHIWGIYNAQEEAEFEYGPVGGDTGEVKYSGSFFVTSYEINPSVGEKATFSVSFRISTAVARGTFA